MPVMTCAAIRPGSPFLSPIYSRGTYIESSMASVAPMDMSENVVRTPAVCPLRRRS